MGSNKLCIYDTTDGRTVEFQGRVRAEALVQVLMWGLSELDDIEVHCSYCGDRHSGMVFLLGCENLPR